MYRIDETLDSQFPQTIKSTPEPFVAGFTDFSHGPSKRLTDRNWL